MFVTRNRLPVFIIFVLVPIFIQFNAVQAQEDNTTTHIIQPGENLFRIALDYGLTTEELAVANGITDATRIFAGQSLVIPTGAIVVVDEPVTEDVTIVEAVEPEPDFVVADASPVIQQTEPVYHTIQRGETLRELAEGYGITEAELIELNSIANPNRILAGQQLLIRNEIVEAEIVVVENTAVEEVVIVEASAPEEVVEAAAPVEAPAEATIHTVQAGEYISAIARRYGITNDMLTAANNITNPDQLYAGQELIIPVGLSSTEVDALIYAAPGAINGTGREIIVDLSNSRVYAYENGILMYEAVSSNGLPATPTVQGTFTVRSKVRSQTMSGPGYWLPNVEWVMYFYQGYALHGAYWHENWGQPMSHGCVNLTNTDAKWFYEFAQIGTPVTVQL